MPLYLRYAVRSDLGLVRNNNEDSVYAGPRLLAIADGMGGHAAGEVASKIVITTFEHLDEDRRIDDLAGELRNAVFEANRRIADAVEQNGELEGMGTTLTALRFVGSQAGLVHVGDSRAYLLRAGTLDQITHDDTYVQWLVDTGKLTPDEAKDHPRKSVILRALLGTDVDPDVSIREAFAGDRYMLCSDGLSDVVSIDTIGDTLLIDDPQEAADRLVELALRGGGPDNVTVIVADVLMARGGDAVDDVPVIAGAFVDPAAADIPSDPGADSAAERAGRLGRSAPPAATEPMSTRPRRRQRWKSWFLAGAAVLLIVAVLGGVYAWTQTQHFVGQEGNHVAIFRGVNTSIGPIHLYSRDVDERSLTIASLCPSDRDRIKDGIDASSKSDAERVVAQLRDNRSSCSTPKTCHHTSAPVSPSSSPSPTETPATTPSSVRTSGEGAAPGRRSTSRSPANPPARNGIGAGAPASIPSTTPAATASGGC